MAPSCRRGGGALPRALVHRPALRGLRPSAVSPRFGGKCFHIRPFPATTTSLWIWAATPLVGASFVLILTLLVTLLKWCLVGRIRAGTYPLHGAFYVRNWLLDRLLALSLDVIGGVHATLYVPSWYRALGAKVGKMGDLSTAMSTTLDLLELASGSTIADEVTLGPPHIEGGWMTVRETRLGRRAFVGNSGVVPTGTVLGDESLVGVLSLAPQDRTQATEPRASWLGSPPILLPRRQPSAQFTEERTYCPPSSGGRGARSSCSA